MIKIPENLSSFAKFITFCAANKEHQAKQLEKLNNAEKNFNNSLKKIAKEEKDPDPNDYSHTHYRHICVLNTYLRDYDKKVFEIEEYHIKKIIQNIAMMRSFIETSEFISVRVVQFLNELQNEVKTETNYLKLKSKRRSIKNKRNFLIRSIYKPDYKAIIQNEFINVNSLFEQEFQYAPPSQLDVIISDFLHRSQFRDIIYPTAKIISNGDVDTAMYTISQFCLEVYKALNLTIPKSKAIVYTSIIRILFNESYCIDAELNAYKKEDGEFLIKANEFSKRTVRDLKLTNDISRYYTPGLPLTTLFKPKQIDMLKQIEFMTNPLDIMKQIHTITVSLAQFFGSENGMLSFDDMLTLLLALVSISPPTNCVSISKFIEKWRQLQINDVIGNAKDFFVAAVETLSGKE